MCVRAARHFLNREKFFAWLLICALFLQSFFYLFGDTTLEPSPALDKLQAAQDLYESKENKKEFIEELFSEDTKALVLIFGALIFGCGLLGAGFILFLVCAIRLTMGRRVITRVYDDVPIVWGLDAIAKTIILFYSCALFTGFFFGLANDFIFASQTENLFILVHTFFMDGLILFFVLYVVGVEHKQSLKTIGLNGTAVFRDMFLGFSSYCVVLPLFVLLVAGLSYLIKIVHYEPPPHPLVDIFISEDKQNPYLIYLSIILACTIGPFIEEVFFRGFCYTTLKKKIGVRNAMILTSVFFAFIHYSLFAFLPIFFLGMVLTYLYEKRGSLVPSITLHIVHNSLFIGYFFMVKRVFLDKV